MKHPAILFICFCLLLLILSSSSCKNASESAVQNAAAPLERSTLQGGKKALINYVGGENNDVLLHVPFDVTYNKFNNKVYLCDIRANTIFILDESLNLLEQFSRTGQGPGEFNEPWSLCFNSQGEMFLLDSNNLRVQILNSEHKYVHSFPIHLSGIKSGIQINSQDRIYVSQPSKNSLFTVYSRQGEELEHFGSLIPEVDELTQQALGRKDLPPFYTTMLTHKVSFAIDDEDNLFCALQEYAILRKYNSRHELVFERDYSQLPIVKAGYKDWEDAMTGKDNEHFRSSIGMAGSSYTFKQLIGNVSCDAHYVYVSFDFTTRHNSIFAIDKSTGDVVKELELELADTDFHFWTSDLSGTAIYAVDAWKNAVLAKYEK